MRIRIVTEGRPTPAVLAALKGKERQRFMSASARFDRLPDERLLVAAWRKWKRETLGMDVREQIDRYIDDQPPVKREELRDLHRRILAISPDAKLWFLDGRNDDGKVVSNPNIGYGSETLSYATGASRAFYKIGLSANTSGLSVYVMGLKDKTYLPETYGSRLGKAKITGYCISFKSVRDVDVGVLEAVFANALGAGSTGVSP